MKNLIKKDWIVLPCDITEWEFYHDRNTFYIYLHLLLKSDCEVKKYKNIPIYKGELCESYNSIGTALELTVNQVRYSLNKLEEKGYVARIKRGKLHLISITNMIYLSQEHEGKEEIIADKPILKQKELTFIGNIRTCLYNVRRWLQQ